MTLGADFRKFLLPVRTKNIKNAVRGTPTVGTTPSLKLIERKTKFMFT